MIPIDTAATLDQLSKVKSDNFNAWHCKHSFKIQNAEVYMKWNNDIWSKNI